MTWIPPEERDTRYPIWYKRYKCRVKYIESLGIDKLREQGMPTIFDSGYDQVVANELVTRMLTINEMVEYYKNNVVIYVVNYNDTKVIYDEIMAHLNAWKHYLDTNLMADADAPIEDLILLDKFANIVYKHATYLFTDDYLNSDFIKLLRGVTLVDLSDDVHSTEPKTVKKHNPIFDKDHTLNPMMKFTNGKPGLTKWG